MASQTQGIQQLLAAEKRAAEKVSEARKRKLTFFTERIFIDFLRSNDFLLITKFWQLQASRSVSSRPRKRLRMRLKSTDRNASDNSRSSKLKWVSPSYQWPIKWFHCIEWAPMMQFPSLNCDATARFGDDSEDASRDALNILWSFGVS